MILALSGNDGSGKTTLARRLSTLMRDCGVDVEYREEFKYLLLSYGLRLFGSRVEQERRRFLEGSEEGKVEFKHRLWVLAVLFNSIVENLWFKAFRRGRLTVLDRCLVDHLASFEYLGYVRGFTRKLFLNAPKPLVVVLDADPKVMYERKKRTHRYPLRFYRVQRLRYLQIAKELKLPVVETDRPIEDAVREILRILAVNLSKEEDLVLHVLSDPYGYADSSLLNHVDFKKLNFRYILLEASRNNVEFQIYEKLTNYPLTGEVKGKTEEIREKIGEKFRRILKVIGDIGELFERRGVEYVFFKTLPPFRQLPRDLDVLVDDFAGAVGVLKEKGFRIVKTHRAHPEVSLERDGVEIDLHWGVEWAGRRVLDENEFLSNRVLCRVDGVDVYLPSPEYELTVVLAHSVLQHGYLTLGELHFIRGLVDKYRFDWKKLFVTAERGGWLNGLNILLNIVKVKDLLFYAGKIFGKIPGVKGETALNVSRLTIPVTWLPITVLDSKSLHILRYLLWKICGRLPYNEPEENIEKIL